jgi:glycosyltransferase involved in cell wall biosynthesis
MTKTKSVAIYLTSMTMGGAERVALNLCKGLIDDGYEVDLVLVEATGELLNDVPAEVSVVDLEADRVLTSLLPLRKYISSRKPDVLYAMMTEPNVVAVGAHRTIATDTRLILSEHNMLSRSSETIKNYLARAGAWLLYPLADAIVAVSEGVQADLLANTRLNGDDISIIYNPVDIESIRNQALEPVEHEWLADDDLTVILSGGRHVPQKGFDILLDAFLHIERDDVRLLLFGTGQETESLKRQASALGISEQVCFLGFVENPYAYMAAADVFVLSSKYEGFGLVLIEALACGCPVVSTDCESGPAEILEQGKYGPLVPVGDVAALAASIKQVLNYPPESNSLRTRSDDFNIETAISQYESLF